MNLFSKNINHSINSIWSVYDYLSYELSFPQTTFLISMGCVTSKTDIQLGNVDPWFYMENGERMDISEEEVNRKREVKIAIFIHN